MPSNSIGQLITFAVELQQGQQFASYIYIHALKNDTCAKIAARRGHPELAATIARLNKVRSVRTKLRTGRKMKLPGKLASADVLTVLAGDDPPVVVDGYAMFQTVNVIGRKGISQFIGYDPLALSIPICFQALPGADGTAVEAGIAMLERFAGRGRSSSAVTGPPAVLRVSVTDNNGNVVPLLPPPYQWSHGTPNAPLYQIGNPSGGSGSGGISWGTTEPDVIRLRSGKRIRQTATVTLSEFTPVNVVPRSAAQRSKAKKK